MEDRKSVALIIPSYIVAKGLETILDATGEFLVSENIYDCSRSGKARLRNIDPDIVVIDPAVLDFQGRKEGRMMIGELCDSVVLALEGPAVNDEILRQYDGSISLYDSPSALVRKLHNAIDSRQAEPFSDSGELSVREKEILVCVAQGMLNKEIADKFNISIYTVISHRKNITRKTGIKTVAGLTVYALLNNLIDIGSVQS